MEKELSVQREARTPEGVERIAPRRVFVPRADIIEDDEKVLLLADMPGVEESGVDITLEKNRLSIRGTVKPSGNGQKKLYREFESGDYERSFLLSNAVKREGIAANIRNGVLSVTLPKGDEARTRKIPVTSH